MYACIHAPNAGVLAQSFSPWVEIVDEKTAVFSLTPRQIAEKIYERIPGAQADAQVAVASTAESAILAARNLPGLTFLAPGKEAGILGALPIDCLPPDPEIFQTLDLWGIHSLAELARLPEKGIAERLGPRGLWLQKMARGALDRPLKPEIPASTYEEFVEFDDPLELLEPLLFQIGRFLYDLCARLDAQSLAASAVHLTLNRQERMLRLPFPTRDIKFLLKLIQHDLEAHPPSEPVERVRLAILPTEPRRVQHGLFAPAAPEPERLELTLGKIRGIVGADNVGYPQLTNTHRPGAGFTPLASLAFRYFRPPEAARVETESGVPKKLWTRVCRGEIMKIAGPWRSSGDWWRPDSWNRDEWDVALTDGALYRIYLDRKVTQWFLEGSYD
jgi:protein ImuB